MVYLLDRTSHYPTMLFLICIPSFETFIGFVFDRVALCHALDGRRAWTARWKKLRSSNTGGIGHTHHLVEKWLIQHCHLLTTTRNSTRVSYIKNVCSHFSFNCVETLENYFLSVITDTSVEFTEIARSGEYKWTNLVVTCDARLFMPSHFKSHAGKHNFTSFVML